MHVTKYPLTQRQLPIALVHRSYAAAFYVGSLGPGGMCAHLAMPVRGCIEIIAIENDHLELHEIARMFGEFLNCAFIAAP